MTGVDDHEVTNDFAGGGDPRSWDYYNFTVSDPHSTGGGGGYSRQYRETDWNFVSRLMEAGGGGVGMLVYLGDNPDDNPDRPIIVGRLYNAGQMPSCPYPLCGGWPIYRSQFIPEAVDPVAATPMDWGTVMQY